MSKSYCKVVVIGTGNEMENPCHGQIPCFLSTSWTNEDMEDTKREVSMKKKAIIVDTGTGEIMTTFNEGDRIMRGGSAEYLSEGEVWNIERFFKGSTRELRELNSELDIYEKAFLFSISVYVGYYDCCIKYDNGRVMGISDIISISGMSRSMVYGVINSLRKKDILYKGKNSRGIQLFVNPWLFCKGRRISKVLRTMFKNYRVRVINKRWGDM